MRPPEIDVTLSLYELSCKTTNDSGGDEPYMWILGFKVDADTIEPNPGSLIPKLGVQVFPGMPASPFVVGPDQSIDANESLPIPAALGSRSFRLKPDLLDIAGWFPGLAGVVCLLWDQDNFDPGTAEAGQKKFNQLFGPSLSTQLNSLFSGGFDDLAKDVNGNATPFPESGPDLTWRFARLRDSAGRKNAVKAITRKVRDDIFNRVKDAIKDEAGWDELLDPDDMLGVDAQVFLGDELSSTRNFSLSFTDEDSDYTIKGHAMGSRVHVAALDTTVPRAVRTFDRDIGLWRQVCWFSQKLYWANAFRIQSTTRFELRSVVGGAPVSVRWFLDDVPLADGTGSISVMFESVDKYAGPPQDALAPYYPGGPSLLLITPRARCWKFPIKRATAFIYGTVKALYSYAGDPSLFPPTPPAHTTGELLGRGYSQEAELGIIAVHLEMDDEYKKDVKSCKRVIDDIDRKHIAVFIGRGDGGPGDPMVTKQELLDRVTSLARVANAVALSGDTNQVPSLPAGLSHGHQ